MKTISITWCTEDVLNQAEERGINLTEEQADKILDLMDKKHDCTIGINWDVIDVWIDYVLDNN